MEATLVDADENSYDGSRNGFSIWVNTRRLQSLSEALFSCLQATSDCVNCMMAAGFTGT